MSDTPLTDAVEREFPLTWFDERERYHRHAHEWREHAHALERKLADLAPVVEKAIRDLESGAAEVRQARNEILRADTDARRAVARAERLEQLLEEACAILFIARGAALKLRATGCTHAEGCELIREYDTIMAWTKDARAALTNTASPGASETRGHEGQAEPKPTQRAGAEISATGHSSEDHFVIEVWFEPQRIVGSAVRRLLRPAVTSQDAPGTTNPRAANGQKESEYVAWLYYKTGRDGRPTTIHVCDSDAEGAFKVYRHPADETRPCFMCCGKGDIVSGEVGRPTIRPCSHCHGTGRLPKPLTEAESLALDALTATVAGVPCRFCFGPGNSEGACPDCGEPTQAFTRVPQPKGTP